MKNIIKPSGLIVLILLTLLIHSCKKEEIPTLTTSFISSFTRTSATSGGTITDEGSSTVTTRGVCWSTGITPTLADFKTSDGAGAGSFSSNIIGLYGGTTYFVRAYATNSVGTGYGMAMSFTTLGQPPSAPTVTTLAATNTTPVTAQSNGTVNANYFSTIVTFEYGITTNYGSTITAIQSPVTGGTNINVSANITGLTACTVYHYRIKAVNSLGTTYGSDLTFTTLGSVPTVTTLAATNTTPVTAQSNGTVNANYLSTVVTFEYGTTISYGNTVIATQSPVTGNINTTVSANMTGLTASTVYHYRIKAVNSLGTTYGSDLTFTAVYVIGGNANGGIIFYIDETGQHGLVCAPTNQSTSAAWGCSGITIAGADGTAVGTGNQNTIDILNGCSTAETAAKICYDLVLNTYNDWYLPSKDELGLMYTNLKAYGLGGFAGNFYWSSTEYVYNYFAWAQFFVYPTNSTPGHPNKSDTFYVRAVRAF